MYYARCVFTLLFKKLVRHLKKNIRCGLIPIQITTENAINCYIAMARSRGDVAT